MGTKFLNINYAKLSISPITGVNTGVPEIPRVDLLG